jgi:hypothetical protein
MDWRKNRIAIGAVVFVALLGLTLWVVNRGSRQPTNASEVPTVEIDKASITSLEVKRPGNESVLLSSVDGTWRLTKPMDAEADQVNVESALTRLAELDLARVVATQPENYARLQVDEANAVEVIVNAGDETVATLTIGKYADGMTMLRLDDRPEVFGASGSLRYAFDRELKAWRNRRVVAEEADAVQSVRFASPKGTFAFERTNDGWTPTEGGEALVNPDPKKVTGFVSTAARLTASGFAAEDVSQARAGLTEPKAAVTLTFSEGVEPIVLELGDATEQQGEVYLQRRGNPTLYVVSEYLANRLQPDAEAFTKVDAPPAPPSAMPARPEAQGQPQLPPEIMRQLQEQIRAQQQQQQR